MAVLLLLGLCVKAQFTKLFDFAGTTSGSAPIGSLISDGTFLYGMTFAGGTNNDGTIFKIKPDGTDYLKLYDFDETTTGMGPCGALYSDGTYLYGMTKSGGANNKGTIFKIKPNGSNYTKLLDFSGITTGSSPYYCTLISDGTYLYGTTEQGGTNNYGVVFKIKPDGTGFTKLLDFVHTNGLSPSGSLFFDGTYLYGTTAGGGVNSLGTLFKIKPDGTDYSRMLDFSGTSNGRSPLGTLISDGTYLYGMTSSGGANSNGTIFKIKPDGTAYAKLHDFNVSSSGNGAQGDLTSDGTFLYGMTQTGGANNNGTIFKILPDGSGFVKLYDFAIISGKQPRGSLIYLNTDMYGVAPQGGASSNGTFFKYATIPTGVNVNTNDKNFTIFPNPASDIITLDFDRNDHSCLVLNIYNAMGALVRTELLNQNQQQVDIKNLSNGIYIVEMKLKERTEIQKLIIQR